MAVYRSKWVSFESFYDNGAYIKPHEEDQGDVPSMDENYYDISIDMPNPNNKIVFKKDIEDATEDTLCPEFEEDSNANHIDEATSEVTEN